MTFAVNGAALAQVTTEQSRTRQLESEQSDSPLLESAIPLDFDRGRNVSVQERVRPDYDPLGIQRGSIILFPRVDVGIGASDNIFVTQSGRIADIYAYLAPSLRAETDWNTNQIIVEGGAKFEKFPDHSLRDQTEWFFKALGRLDVSSEIAITAETQITRNQEQPFSGDATANVAVLSSYRRDEAGLRAEWNHDQFREVVSYNYENFHFFSLELTDGARASQMNRNRDIQRVAAQSEYALSPSTAIYAQGTYSWTGYETDVAPGIPNRDSTGWRLIGGLSFDLSGFFRGNIGLGYVRRTYRDSAIYPVVAGLSAEAKLEYFPDDANTFKLNVRRVIEDANITQSSGYFNNLASIGLDHELRTNIILSASGQYLRNNYIGIVEHDNIWRAVGGATYLLNHEFRLRADLSYSNQHRIGATDSFRVDEVAGRLTLIIQR
ncbi:outer membrane beta-barrel protein [Novosphingobium sp.]|uniref:outer membrane beta-barrel protein n=1 Tax=Novosphingobium sp. TaxID=1874826 RepID=UPI003D0D3743